jgi:hypothetical protein
MAGGKVGVETPPPMPHSGGFTTSLHPLRVRCSQSMSPALITQLTDHHVANIPPLHFYSHGSPYPRRSVVTSSTSTTPGVTCSASSIDFMCLRILSTPRLQTAHSHKLFTHGDTRTGAMHHTKIVLPYLTNLTPSPSILGPHCATALVNCL